MRSVGLYVCNQRHNLTFGIFATVTDRSKMKVMGVVQVPDQAWKTHSLRRHYFCWQLAAFPFFESVRGTGTRGFQLANSKATVTVVSTRCPQPLCGCAVGDRWPCHADESQSVWARGILTLCEKCWPGPVLQFFNIAWNLRAAYINPKWTFALFANPVWGWTGHLNCGQTPIMTDKLLHQDLGWGCLVKCCCNTLENTKPRSVSNLYHQNRSIFF